MATRKRKYITTLLSTLLIKLPPPPLTVKELAAKKLTLNSNKILEEILYSTHQHFETDLTINNDTTLFQLGRTPR